MARDTDQPEDTESQRPSRLDEFYNTAANGRPMRGIGVDRDLYKYDMDDEEWYG